MKRIIRLLALIFVLVGCGGGGQDQVNPVEPTGEPKITVSFVVKDPNVIYSDMKISRKVMTGLPKELESKVKYLRVYYDHENGIRHGSLLYEFSDDITIGNEVAVPFSTVVVSVSLLSINETEVAQGTLFKDFQTSWTSLKKIENVPIDINLNQWISSDLAFFNLPGAWSLPAGGESKWYRVKVVTDNHLGNYYQNVMDFCKFVTLGSRMALSLENVWMPFEPRCLQLNCPSVTVKPTIEITVTDDMGKEWKFHFEISSFIPFLEDAPVALHYQQ